MAADIKKVKKFPALVLGAALVAGACSLPGSSSSDASSCAEYASEVRALMATTTNADEVNDFLNDTEEHAARLIQKDPGNGQPCADALLEALFTAADREFAEAFDD